MAALAILTGLLTGCGDPEHRYMLNNDTDGQVQVGRCTDDGCTSVDDIGWIDQGAFADVTLPGDRVTLKVAGTSDAFICAEGDDDVAGVLVRFSAAVDSPAAARANCVS